MNQENHQNAEKIAEILMENFQSQDFSKVKVLDICCGVFDPAGTNYDSKGQIYQPLVAQKLGELDFDVTGVDFREGEILRFAMVDGKKVQGEKSEVQNKRVGVQEDYEKTESGVSMSFRGNREILAESDEISHFVRNDSPININLYFKHRFDINILEENWTEKLEKDWSVLIFLRSWDTPEILLHYQKILDIDDINLLSLEIAKIYLPIFADLLEPKGLFFTTDICNFGICDDEFEIQLYKNQINQLITKNGFTLLNNENGLYFYQKC
jgi:hypothetical protein